jgi:hypothetical protein
MGEMARGHGLQCVAAATDSRGSSLNVRRRCPGTEPCNLSSVPPGAPTRAFAREVKGQKAKAKALHAVPRRSASATAKT